MISASTHSGSPSARRRFGKSCASSDRATLPSSRARRVWVDGASLGVRALEQAVGLLGADRVLLGTDCPIFDTARTLAAVRQARLSEAERERVLASNAQELLSRLR